MKDDKTYSFYWTNSIKSLQTLDLLSLKGDYVYWEFFTIGSTQKLSAVAVSSLIKEFIRERKTGEAERQE